MGRTRLDDRGRVIIPAEAREKLGLKPGSEVDMSVEGGALVLKRVIAEPRTVSSGKRGWGPEAFLDAGEATFGEQ